MDHVAPFTQATLHLLSAVAVHAASTPSEQVEGVEQGAQATLSDADHVVPSTHFELHTRSEVGVQALSTPCLQGMVWHVLQGLFPLSDQRVPWSHRTVHRVSAFSVHTCSIPKEHVVESVHGLHGAEPVMTLNVVPATHGARLGGSVQQSSSLQIRPLHLVSSPLAFMLTGQRCVEHTGSSVQQSLAMHPLADDLHSRRELFETDVALGQEKVPHLG